MGEQPYFIARDTARRAIVVSVRGTMSVQDCITDSMYKPVLLSADAIGMPHLSGAQLHCHAGVVTATNFILSDLDRHRVLHQVLLGEEPKPYTLNPKPQTLNPKPLTLNPKPLTLSPKPQIINP